MQGGPIDDDSRTVVLRSQASCIDVGGDVVIIIPSGLWGFGVHKPSPSFQIFEKCMLELKFKG